MKTKLFTLFLLILFLGTASALTYRFDIDSGKWSQYNAGLTSDFYETDFGQTTYNRNFETAFNQTTSSTSDRNCGTYFCVIMTYDQGAVTIFNSTDFASEGTYSLEVSSNDSSNAILLYGANEIVSDSNVSFDYRFSNQQFYPRYIYYGYVDDQNTFYEVGSVGYADGQTAPNSWQTKTYLVPFGNNRLAYRVTGSQGAIKVFIDNVKINRNNTGTFRIGSASSCGSISSCSNEDLHLLAKDLSSTYWVVDYVAGATCTWSKNGVGQGNMTEGLNGLYYIDTNTYVSSGGYIDVNLSATCSKIPYNTKSFYATPRLNKYGNIKNGNFEEPFSFTAYATNGCSNNWCHQNVTGSPTSMLINTKGVSVVEGAKALSYSFSISGNYTANFYSQSHYATDNNILLYYSCSDGVDAWCSNFKYGYVNDSNAFTEVGTFTDTSAVRTFLNYKIPSGGNFRPSFRVASNGGATMYIDNVMATNSKLDSSLTTSNTLTGNAGVTGTFYSFSSSYLDQYSNPILGATCTLEIDSTPYSMVYNSGTQTYNYSYAFVSSGSHTIETECSSTSYNTQNDSYSVSIITPASESLTFTPIENISGYNLSGLSKDVSFSIQNNSNDIIFKVEALEDYDGTINFSSSLKTSKQYFIYSSDNGSDWVYNQTLTFGVGQTDGLQKIPTNTGYNYAFTFSIGAGSTTYVKLVLQDLPAYWETINSSTDWININQPDSWTDSNSKKWDIFTDSNYSRIQSYTYKNFPDLTSATMDTGFYLQFTAYADNDGNLDVGFRVGSTDSTTSVPITTTPTRFVVSIDPTNNSSVLLVKRLSGSANKFYVTDWALTPKSYFAESLTLKNVDGTPFSAILSESQSVLAFVEGKPMRVQTSAYDVSGNLSTLKFEVLINGTIINSYNYGLTDAVRQGKTWVWDEEIKGIFDLNGYFNNPSVALRQVIVRATLINSSGASVAQQSNTYGLIQYPYLGEDLGLEFYPLETGVAKNPRYRIRITQREPETLVGLKVILWDETNGISDPLYSTTIYQKDLGCTSYVCNKEILLNEYVPTAGGLMNVSFLFLLNTENENLDNPLTLKTFNYFLTYDQLETARILQVFERTDRTYSVYEKIPLVLQLRDIPYKNFANVLNTYLTINICNADTGACGTIGSRKFYPTRHIYDQTTGYNYYYFNNLFLQDNGQFIPDGNYIQFKANVYDVSGGHDHNVLIPTLVDKCQSGYGSNFDYGNFLMNYLHPLISEATRALFGCTTLTDPIVQIGDAQEERILIDYAEVPTGGQNHSIACLKLDQNNYVNTLEQQLICGVFYKKSEQQIDKFNFTLSNEYSDFARVENERQYFTFDVPAEQVIFNDPLIMTKALNVEYQTDSIDTIGEVFFYGVDKIFSGIANPLTGVLEETTRQGLITNVGFDINWDKTFDPNYVQGIYFIRIDGFKVINQYDYISKFPELKELNPRDFRRFMNDKKQTLTIPKTKVTLFTNDLTKGNLIGETLDNLTISSPLVVYEAPSKTNKQDVNAKIIPTILKFNLTSDMMSNNFATQERLFVPLIFTWNVQESPQVDLGNGIIDFFVGHDDLGRPHGLFNNPAGFMVRQWFWIILILMLLVVFSVISKNLNSDRQQNGK